MVPSQAWTFSLPEPVDNDGDDIKVKTDFGFAQNFINVENDHLVIDDTSSLPAGFTTGKITLSDSKSERTYNILLTVLEAV